MDLDALSIDPATTIIQPQPGPQYQFCATPADIAIYGGAGGSGKSFALLLDPCQYLTKVPGFGGVIFRRTYPEITMEGALWDTSWNIYPAIKGKATENDLTWTFPPYNNTISFLHIEHEKSVHRYQGSQIAYIGFDELTSFSQYQFFYLLSRNRSACGVQPYIRATCNPDPDSWVKEFILWWLDANGEFPDYSKSGVLRWFIRDRDEIIWADTRDRLIKDWGAKYDPKSVTFIPAKLSDNPILEQADPGYRGRLMALPFVEQQQLLHGNWAVRLLAGMLFRQEWFEIVDVVPSGLRMVRYWDKAASEVSEANRDPDWTAGVLYATDGRVFYVLDVQHFRKRPGGVEETIQYTARNLDGPGVDIVIEQEPGSSGVDDIEHYVRDVLYGFNVTGDRPTGDKQTRAGIVSAAAQQRLIKILRAPWNLTFLRELVAFPTKGVHDDLCLVGDTLIETDRGLVPIREITTSDKVLTRQGYKNVISSGLTERDAHVLRLTLVNGTTLFGTANHPVITSEGNVIRLDALSGNDMIWYVQNASSLMGLTLEDTPIQKTKLTGSISGPMQATSEMVLGTSTRKSGNPLTDQSPRGTISTTKTAIPLTTQLKTSNASQNVNTSVSTCKNILQNTLKMLKNTLKRSVRLQKNGTGQRQVKLGTQNTVKRDGKTENGIRLFVRFVNGNLKVLLRTQSTAQISVEKKSENCLEGATNQEYASYAGNHSLAHLPKHVLKPVQISSVEKVSVRQDVYNLNVEGAHEFFANGILVHNCDGLSGAHLYLTRNAYGGNQAKSPIPQAAHKGVPISRTGVPAMYTEYNPGSDKMPRM